MTKLRPVLAVAAAGVFSLFATTSVTPALGQYPGMPPGGMPPGAMGAGGGIPHIPKTELTESSAKGAIDAYLAMKEKYGTDTPEPDMKGSAATAFTNLAGVEQIIKGQGFSDTNEWHKTLVSVAMAYGFAKDGKQGEIDESIAKLKNNPQIPAAIKEQMLATMSGIRPSENNLAVVKALLGNSDYKEKLIHLGD